MRSVSFRVSASIPVLALLVVALVSVGCATTEGSPGKRAKHENHAAYGSIVLNGERTEVRWTDGDSFNFKSGPHKGKGTRLQGYNTLEAFGPVHRWGTWTAKELYGIAKGASKVAASEEWECTTDGKEDGYRRLLIDCPKLTETMILKGVAMPYSVEGGAKPQLLEAMKQAQAAKAGMWEKGVAKGIVTSVHSWGEEGQRGDPYNRVLNTGTGKAEVRKHQKRYDTCEEVCEETDGDTSCMVYVPFENRYRDQPKCLRE